MSLYSDYYAERLGKSVLEVPQGFAVYKIEEDFVYIEEIYVVKEHRKSGVAKDMADAIAHVAKLEGAKRMFGSVSVNAKNATTSMKVLLAYGLEVSHLKDDLIVFVKDI